MANDDVESETCTEKCLFYFWHPMLVRPAMKRLFCLKAKNGLKNGLGRFAPSALRFSGSSLILSWLTVSFSFSKKLKNVSCEYDRVNGSNSTLQAAWYIGHVRIIWLWNSLFTRKKNARE